MQGASQAGAGIWRPVPPVGYASLGLQFNFWLPTGSIAVSSKVSTYSAVIWRDQFSGIVHCFCALKTLPVAVSGKWLELHVTYAMYEARHCSHFGCADLSKTVCR